MRVPSSFCTPLHHPLHIGEVYLHRHLARDYERLPSALPSLDFLAFACLMPEIWE